MTSPPRATLGKMQNPARGLIHGAGAIGAAVGIYFLVRRASGVTARLALATFGAGLVFLYSVSALYHSVPWRQHTKRIMQRLDHSAIFVLIASSYTPVAVIGLDGWMRSTTMGIVWAIAAVGIGQHIFFPRHHQGLSITLHLILGWLAVLIVVPLARRIGMLPVTLIAVHGLLYTIGVIIMVTRRPRLWPAVFSSHELFHVMTVLAGSLLFFVTYRYVAPLAG